MNKSLRFFVWAEIICAIILVVVAITKPESISTSTAQLLTVVYLIFATKDLILEYKK